MTILTPDGKARRQAEPLEIPLHRQDEEGKPLAVSLIVPIPESPMEMYAYAQTMLLAHLLNEMVMARVVREANAAQAIAVAERAAGPARRPAQLRDHLGKGGAERGGPKSGEPPAG